MTLFVSGLPYDLHQDELQEIFMEYGAVTSARVIFDSSTHKSKGFGFVKMSDTAAAHQAIRALHGGMIDGRTLVVREAEKRGVHFEFGPKRRNGVSKPKG